MGQQFWVYNTSGTELDAAEPQARWAEYDANIIRSLYILAGQKFHFSRTKCQICLANHYRQYTSTHPATCPQ